MGSGIPPPPYHVQSTIENPQAFRHHTSISELWTTKWQRPCQMGIYPFVDGNVSDFNPIFTNLASASNDSVKTLYDPDAYAEPFFPIAEKLVKQAAEAESKEQIQEAKDLYLRAAAVYRIARFPINRSPLSEKAWQAGKEAYLKGGQYLDPPNAEVLIPHTHIDLSAGDKYAPIPAYLRIPTGTKPSNGWPVLLFICGLDAYRTDHTNRTNMHIKAGFATLSVEIPGTGDCPAAKNDPTSPDRLFSSLLDWIVSNKEQYGLDDDRIVARGVSTGGYYAFRIAHTHASRLFAAVAQGGGSHWMFEPEWIRAQDHMEYPFALAEGLAYKFGYNSVDEYVNDEPIKKFSLKDSGLLQRKSCRLLVINGMEDSIFPIEDSLLVASEGRVKDVRLVQGKGHMGNPGAEEIIIDWIAKVVDGDQ